jgi:hypothetical protein
VAGSLLSILNVTYNSYFYCKSSCSDDQLKISHRDPGSSVGTATGYGLDDWMIGARFPAGAENFCLHQRVQTDSRAQPPIQWVMGTPSLGVKRPGREADHLPPPSAEAKEYVELYLHSNTSSCSGA